MLSSHAVFANFRLQLPPFSLPLPGWGMSNQHRAADWHVATNGFACGLGTPSAPWDISSRWRVGRKWHPMIPLDSPGLVQVPTENRWHRLHRQARGRQGAPLNVRAWRESELPLDGASLYSARHTSLVWT